MQPDDHQRKSGLIATNFHRWQAEVSGLRQGVAVTRSIWRMERDKYHEQRQRLLKVLGRLVESTNYNPELRTRLEKRVKQVEFQEHRVDRTAKRITELEDALEQAEQSLYSAADQVVWPEVVFTSATTETSSDPTGPDSDTSEDGSAPEELEQYFKLIEELRLLRETHHNIYVDQIQEARRREAEKEGGELLRESDFDFHERQRLDRSPLTKELIEKTRLAEEAMQRCVDSGIPVQSLDELIPPLELSELSPLSNFAAPFTLETSAHQPNHLELSLIPMTAVDERINDWTHGITQNGFLDSSVPTETATPTVELQDSSEIATRFPTEETGEHGGYEPQNERRSWSSNLYKPEDCRPRPYERHAMSVSVPTFSSTNVMHVSIPATPNSFG